MPEPITCPAPQPVAQPTKPDVDDLIFPSPADWYASDR